MIHINFTEPETQEWKDWRTLCDSEQKEHNKLIESERSSEIKDKLYKGQKKVYINPNGPFHGKCAYCEQKIFADQHGDLDHFRPKNRVIDEKTGKPITIIEDGKIKNHPGYYWLVYDWKNLLPSCILCNRPSSQHSLKPIGKRDFFPVKGFRAVHPGEEIKEKPLLIHPVFDNPEDHLEINDLGIFSSKNNSIRGKMCIKIFGLNVRGLPDMRKKTYTNVKMKMDCLFQLLSPDRAKNETIKNLINEIREIRNGVEEFTVAARKAIVDYKKDNPFIWKLLMDNNDDPS